MTTINISALDEQFNTQCKVISLKYEYGVGVTEPQWAIISSLTENEIMNAFPEQASRYAPFVVLTPMMGEAIQKYTQNEDKHRKRKLRSDDIYGYDDEISSQFHGELLQMIWIGYGEEHNTMSAKNKDDHNRFRSQTIAFRVSPEEDKQINIAVSLSGMTKQDYITHKLLDRTINVKASCKVHRAVYDRLTEVIEQLERINSVEGIDDELMENISLIARMVDGLYITTN